MTTTRWRGVDHETPSGALDGINAIFTLAFTPIAGSVHLLKRGLRMTPGAENDYTIWGRTITFNVGAVPQDGDNLVVDYRTTTPWAEPSIRPLPERSASCPRAGWMKAAMRRRPRTPMWKRPAVIAGRIAQYQPRPIFINTGKKARRLDCARRYGYHR